MEILKVQKLCKTYGTGSVKVDRVWRVIEGVLTDLGGNANEKLS